MSPPESRVRDEPPTIEMHPFKGAATLCASCGMSEDDGAHIGREDLREESAPIEPHAVKLSNVPGHDAPRDLTEDVESENATRVISNSGIVWSSFLRPNGSDEEMLPTLDDCRAWAKLKGYRILAVSESAQSALDRIVYWRPFKSDEDALNFLRAVRESWGMPCDPARESFAQSELGDVIAYAFIASGQMFSISPFLER